MHLLSVPFYDFPSSPILIIGAIGIFVALAVFFLAYQKYFNSPFNKELQLKKVNTGVFQITVPNSTKVSSWGSYDTTTIKKDITAVMGVTFAVKK